MKKLIQIECHRAFHSSGFWISLCIGCAIVIAHFFTTVLPAAPVISFFTDPANADKMMMNIPGRLYSIWLGGSPMNMFTTLYFLILPLLAVLPFGSSLFQDLHGGFTRSVCVRANRKDYFGAKYIATFLSGGTAVVIPLVFSFLVTSLFHPMINPEPATSSTLIRNSSNFPWLFQNLPLVYVAIYLVIIFLFSGLFACVGLIATYHVGYSFLVLIAPFAIYMLIASLASLASAYQWAPMYFLRPSYDGNSLIPMAIFGVLLLVLTTLPYLHRGTHDDLF